MCDTLAFFSRIESGRSFFAKNSDRDPGELQIIEMIYDAGQNFETDFLPEKLAKYTDGPFLSLKKIFGQFEHPYAALISRPLWIWGAEMGINEKGVAIGNEAVFSKEKLNDTGLLGMDILRLALHNTENADTAADFIIHLLEKQGQGGNGSYSGTLKYHNSFLIKDRNKAIVLESSANSWVCRDVSDSVSISNCYTIENNYYRSSEDLQGRNIAKALESRFYTFFAKGHFRQNYTSEYIKNQDQNLSQLFSLLRSHINTQNNRPKGGMKSICVHPGILVKSETTSSLVVDYCGSQQIIWHTSAPNPCVSLYKPIIIGDTKKFSLFTDRKKSEAYFRENRQLSEYFLKNHDFFMEKIEPLRDETERTFQEIIYNDIAGKSKQQLANDCLRCYRIEKEYLSTVKQRINQNKSTS
ncbi:MAG: dipeptidase [bacterium]|nr:MAG: dipeptidase [bacterium]